MTQEFLSRKIVTAWLEDRRGDIPEGAPEGYEGELIEGYAVKYSNGHISWCPKTRFEEDSLPLGNILHLPLYQQRVIAETIELYVRTQSLGEFLEKAKTNDAIQASMSPRGFELLNKQHAAMVALHEILDARIEDMSDVGGIAALFKHDPLLEEATTQGAVEDLVTPVIDRSVRLKGLGQDDGWLLEQLEAIKNKPELDESIKQDWGIPEARIVEVTLPLKTARTNIFMLLGDAGIAFDTTDSIGTFGLKHVIDVAGEPVAYEEGKVYECEGSRHLLDICCRFGEEALNIALNKETGNITLESDVSLEGATVTLNISLHNLNRRVAQ